MRNTKIPYVTDIRIRLSWDAPDDDSVTGYQILRRRPTEGEHALSVYVPDTGSAATSYTDTGVDAGTKYVYRVKAINEAGVGPSSRRVVITTSPPVRARSQPFL